MEVGQIMVFFKVVANDPRISTAHICLYLALFCQWSQINNNNPMPVKKEEIMEVAKINARPTYFKCIRDLHDFGYIKYMPAKHRYMKSYVCLAEF
jgi:hypothetical protein